MFCLAQQAQVQGLVTFFFFLILESQFVQEGCEIKQDIKKCGLRQSGLPLVELADKEKNVCGAALKHSALCRAGNLARLLDCNLSLDSRSRCYVTELGSRR